MERVLGIGGYFVRAVDPAALSEWYRECLGLDVDQHGIWRQEAGTTVFATFESDTDYFGARDQQTMLNFRVRDLDAMLAQLRAKGADVADGDRGHGRRRSVRLGHRSGGPPDRALAADLTLTPRRRADVPGWSSLWRCPMAVSYQLVIDCASPEPLARFWAEALQYVVATPPPDFETWDDFYRSIGIPEEELGHGIDRIEDPNGEGPAIWFQVVPDRKSVKNRDPHRRPRQQSRRFARGPARAGRGRGGPAGVPRSDAAAHPRRGRAGPLRGGDADPEGNEFDVN